MARIRRWILCNLLMSRTPIVLILRTRHFVFTAVWLAVGCLIGCSNTADPANALAQANSTNVQRLSNLYFEYQSEHNWRGPADEAAFKKYLHAYDPARLSRIGIEPNNLDGLFLSERDGQPFKIRYNILGGSRGSTEPVIFETTGENGQRLVGFISMPPREVDVAEYDRLLAGGK